MSIQTPPSRDRAAAPRAQIPISSRLAGSFAELGSVFHTRLPAQALPDPYLVCVSDDALRDCGFAPDAAADPAFIQRFAGANAPPAAADATALPTDLPYATVYSGHQFGNWAGQLGDGRAVSLGELTAPDGRRLEVQLKGSGMTPYSRMGDGRAVLRSSIREFLCSEAMDALGIPTTRALCVIGSDLPVRRETLETAAIVTRYAPSLVRFGHFEHFWSTGQHDALRQLADHVIARAYPALRDMANPYLALLGEVGVKTADLIARWQAVGFCHGVMNTDNMSILGLTIDYGPFGFLDAFDAKHICNHTDQQGRYSYQNQPQVAYWNLFCLAQALLPLIAAPRAGDAQPDDDSDAARDAIEQAKAALEPFKPRYAEQFAGLMRAKLGLTTAAADDSALIDRLLQLMHANRADFTLTFRRLANISVDAEASVSTGTAAGIAVDVAADAATDAATDAAVSGVDRAAARDLFLDRPGFDAWLADYRVRLAVEGRDDATRRAAMNRVNPCYVLRNHLAEVAIRAAQEKDFSETRRLLDVLRHPFDEQPEHAAYAALPPDWATSLEVSCSS
ncbi:MAG: protein adenylyltransferase SelO [Janthinobacterium lividum]